MQKFSKSEKRRYVVMKQAEVIDDLTHIEEKLKEAEPYCDDPKWSKYIEDLEAKKKYLLSRI